MNNTKYFSYNVIKGRIAETLIQQLFLECEYNVFPYGMERTVPGIMELLRGVKGEVAHIVRHTPDFIMQHKPSGKLFFVEVKYRADGIFGINDLPEMYPFHNSYIIIISKRHIKCLTVEELKNGQVISPDSRNFLYKKTEFCLEESRIKDFCKFAVKFFSEV